MLRATLTLILSIFILVTAAVLSGASALASDTTWAAATKWRSESKVNVLLTVQSHEKAWNVTDLLAYTDVALTNEHASMMNGLCKAELEDFSLKTTLHNFCHSETQDIIQLLLALQQQAKADHTAQQGVASEDALLVLLVEGEESACCC